MADPCAVQQRRRLGWAVVDPDQRRAARKCDQRVVWVCEHHFEVLQTMGISGDLIDGIPVQNKPGPLSRVLLAFSCELDPLA